MISIHTEILDGLQIALSRSMEIRAVVVSGVSVVSFAICCAQLPLVTPTIATTPTPTPVVTPSPGTTPNGLPYTFGGTPTPTISPPANAPTPAELIEQYQPQDPDPQAGTRLEWVPIQPTDGGVNGSGQWPIVIVLHAGDYRGGSYYDGLNTTPQDLADAGFYVVLASYPLAPKNLIKGQYPHDSTDQGIDSGRPPQQTRAVEAVVNAARNDSHCYHGLVGILGGSSGGGHAAFVALDETNTGLDWPFWNSLARPNFVACLSGQFDFAERDDVDLGFIRNVENYTHSTTPMDQWMASPIANATSNIIPMYFIRSEDDPKRVDNSKLIASVGIDCRSKSAFDLPNDRKGQIVPITARIAHLELVAPGGESRIIG